MTLIRRSSRASIIACEMLWWYGILLSVLPSLSYGKYSYISISLQFLGTCTTGDVRLYGGATPQEGTVEYCSHNSWHSACNYGWDCREANVVCRELGYEKAGQLVYISSSNLNLSLVSVVSNSYYTFGHRYSLYSHYYYSCTGSESSLVGCSLQYSSYCYYYYSTPPMVGVHCLNIDEDFVDFSNHIIVFLIVHNCPHFYR